MHKASVLVSALLLSACAVGPNYQKPFFSLPDHWPWQQDVAKHPDVKRTDTVSRDWWQDFKDPALNAVIDEGRKNNADLVIAAARVAQARALLSTRQSDLYPSLDVQGGATRTSRSQEATISGFPASSKPFNDINLAAVLNYELDLWGRLRRANESGRAALLAEESNREAVRLAVTSDIAQGYFNLRALDAQIDVTDDTIKTRREALKFQETQYRLGGANGLAYRQAEAELAAAEAQMPQLEQARAEQESALAVLLGRSPKDIIEGKVKTGKSIDALPASPLLPTNLPSTLLERRPDIAAAELDLVSANADIGVARADYFPRVSLTALLGLASSDADRLLRSSARNWQAGATFSGPLLNAGRTRAGIAAAEGRRDEALANYQQTVRNAFKQVMDSLSAEKTSAAREKAQTAQMNARNETVRLSQLRYKSGYSDYLEVLDAQRSLFSARLERINARRDRLTSAVNLYKALGGGWSPDKRIVKATKGK
ncbi:MAG: transporter [Alphaproteobacteria bacterium]|nr:transporter [Alphaproteobacteria bacterium]